MKRKLTVLSVFFVVCGLLLTSTFASATLVGDSVFGTLNFGGYGATNFFDPANSFVPAGSSGIQPWATVSEDDSSFFEFMFQDGFSGINVDVDAFSIYLNQYPVAGGGSANSWVVTISDLDFSDGAVLANIIVNSTIPGLSTSFTADSVTLSYGGGTLPCNGFDANIELQTRAVPLPGAVWLLGSGLLGLAGVRKRFKR